jgi:predicted dehydrogenase
VVVEKAFTRTSAEADHLIAVSKETGKILTCFQNRRWDSDFLTMRYLIENDAFGKITEFDNHYDIEFPTWINGWTAPKYSDGEGMLFGLGSHTIDQTLQLFGPPARITAFIRALRGADSEIEDSFTVIMAYDGKNGNPRSNKHLLCTVSTTMVTPMQAPIKCLIRGMEGSFVKFGTDPQEAQVPAGMTAKDKGFGVEDESLWGTLTTFNKAFDKCQTDKPDGVVVPPKGPKGETKFVGKYPSKVGNYCGYYEDLVKAMNGEKKVECDPTQSRDGLKVIELARKSAMEGRTVEWTN